MTSVRKAVSADVPAIAKMAETFLASEYRDRFADLSAVRVMAENLIASDDGLALVAERDEQVIGMMGATTYLSPFTNQIVATEICWWVNPEARGSRVALRMLNHAEDWARSKGARAFQMIAPSDHVAEFYQRLGFRRLEIHYERAL